MNINTASSAAARRGAINIFVTQTYNGAMYMKTAFVLAGGGIKGAWQAGVLDTLYRAHIEPNYVYGISIGAINSVLAATMQSPGEFWLRHVNTPSQFFSKRSLPELAFDIAKNGFKSLVRNDRLVETMNRLDWQGVAKSDIRVEVGAVGVSDGKIYYADQHHYKFRDWVLASTSIPIIFPAVSISGGLYVDGGLRDMVPLSRAIRLGAETIYVVSPHPAVSLSKNLNAGNLTQYVNRIVDIVISNTIENDIHVANRINKLIDMSDKDTGYRKISVHLIRPSSEISVDIDKFNKNDIEDMVLAGRNDAHRYLTMINTPRP